MPEISEKIRKQITSEKENPDEYDITLRKAENLRKKGEVNSAQKMLEELISKYPERGEAWVHLDLLFLPVHKKIRKVLLAIERSLELDRKNPGLWVVKGTVLEMLEKQDRAMKCYSEALRIDPKNDSALFRRGDIYYCKAMYTEALDYYDQAIAINPKNEIVWNNKGFALFMLGRRHEAIDCYDEAISIKPDYAIAWYNKAYTLHAWDALEKASRYYDRALEINPQDEVCWNNKGNAVYNIGRLSHRPIHFEKAIQIFEKAIEINSDYEIAWNNIGNALICLGRYEESLPYHDKAIECNPEFYFGYHAKAEALYRMGLYRKALRLVRKAIWLNPDYAASYFVKGMILTKLGRYDSARLSFNEAILRDPSEGKFWLAYGRLFEKLNDSETAMKYFDEAIRCYDTRARDTGKAIPWADKGKALEEVGFYRDAMEVYETGLLEDPNSEYTLICKSKLLAYFGDIPEALSTIDECLRYHPEEDAPWAARGSIFIEKERYAEALECFEKAWNIRKSAESAVLLAFSHILLENTEAIRFLQVEEIERQSGKEFQDLIDKGKAHFKEKEYSKAVICLMDAVESLRTQDF